MYIYQISLCLLLIFCDLAQETIISKQDGNGKSIFYKEYIDGLNTIATC